MQTLTRLACTETLCFPNPTGFLYFISFHCCSLQVIFGFSEYTANASNHLFADIIVCNDAIQENISLCILKEPYKNTLQHFFAVSKPPVPICHCNLNFWCGIFIARLVNTVSISLTARNEQSLLVGVLFGLTDYAYWLYVTDLGVDRDYTRRGIGKRLIISRWGFQDDFQGGGKLWGELRPRSREARISNLIK